MRLKISKSKNVTIYYVIKTVYVNGKEKTVTVERLGNEDEVLKKSEVWHFWKFKIDVSIKNA